MGEGGTVTIRLTWRQLRLLDWMRAPHHADLPEHPAIKWTDAMWKVSDLVRLSGVTVTYNYARCRLDLEALKAQDLVYEFVPGRWRVREDYL